MKSIKNFIISQFVPLHSNHMTDSGDLEYNWEFCKKAYGDFSLQLINFKTENNRVNLPSKKLFKNLFLAYLVDPSNSTHFFKTQWVMSEYLTKGWKYPVQAVWNHRMRWWEIHPGFLRGLIYNLFDVKEWTAWYQPVNNKNIDPLVEFNTPKEIYHHFAECHHISTHVVNYFNKPLMTICVHVTDNNDSVKLHEQLFLENIKKGINIKGNDEIIKLVKKEINKWPDSFIKNQIVFNLNSFPSLTINKFNEINFYAGLYFFGSTIKDFTGLDLTYRNN